MIAAIGTGCKLLRDFPPCVAEMPQVQKRLNDGNVWLNGLLAWHAATKGQDPTGARRPDQAHDCIACTPNSPEES